MEMEEFRRQVEKMGYTLLTGVVLSVTTAVLITKGFPLPAGLFLLGLIFGVTTERLGR